ncbi:hypothetical protein chiPu_0012858 [Chiloscyllium punctatum]|uniref:Uncharacterized protein n=1 Tax=Chiloscyllium punctatum TaxID=137246 RepID=A0A401SVG8_CHIPU|nr:hypothetical protein [Chiloscyllium punctatum]
MLKSACVSARRAEERVRARVVLKSVCVRVVLKRELCVCWGRTFSPSLLAPSYLDLTPLPARSYGHVCPPGASGSLKLGAGTFSFLPGCTSFCSRAGGKETAKTISGREKNQKNECKETREPLNKANGLHLQHQEQ